MTKWHRDLRKKALRLDGVASATYEFKGKKTHVVLVIQANDGTIYPVTTPKSPSCARAFKNQLAFIRRTVAAGAGNDNTLGVA